MNLHWHIIITPSPQLPWGFTLGLEHSIGLSRYIDTCPRYYHTKQFYCPKNPFPPPPQTSATPDPFYCLHSFAFPRAIHTRHTVCSLLSHFLFHLTICTVFSLSLHGFSISLQCWVRFIVGCTSDYLCIHQPKNIWVVPTGAINKVTINIYVQGVWWTQVFKSCWEILDRMIAGSYIKNMFSFVRKLTSCLPKWLYHFEFPPTSEGSSCPTSSSAFGVVSGLAF